MADQVRKASYCYVKVPNRAGRGDAILAPLAEAGVSLQAQSGFPARGRKAQLDFITDQPAVVKRVAKRHGLRASATKRCFLIQGEDRVGAVHHHLAKLAKAGINVTAAQAVTAGKRRYGMMLWVKPKDFPRAARVLGAR